MLSYDFTLKLANTIPTAYNLVDYKFSARIKPVNNEMPARHEDEIDLIELIGNLWKERLIIMLCTAVATLLGLAYVILTPPTYEAKAQLQMPTIADLAPLNNTQLFKVLNNDKANETNEDFFEISPQTAFNSMLNILESESFIDTIIYSNPELIGNTIGVDNNKIERDTIDIEALYTINYPNSKKVNNSSKPNILTIQLETKDRKAGTNLLNTLVNSATITYTNNLKDEFDQLKISKIQNLETEYNLLDISITEKKESKITQLKEQQALETKQTEDELLARKSFILSSRKDRIIQLEEAIKIAKLLNLEKPSTLSQLGQNDRANNGQVEVNTEIRNQGEPLYLRGTKLLSAELSGLKELSEKTFLDSQVRQLEAKLITLSTNREIELLQKRKDNLAFDKTLQEIKDQINKLNGSHFPSTFEISFLDSEAKSAPEAIKPRKVMIIFICIVFGGMIGFFVAIARIIYKNRRVSWSS